jgi:Ca2+-binding RTX toxin-like protein
MRTAKRTRTLEPVTFQRRAAMIAAAAAIALALVPRPVAAQNILPNGRFDSDVAPFSSPDPDNLLHDAVVDVGSPATPGSLKLVNDFGPFNNVLSANYCLAQPITPGGYYFEYWVRFTTGESANGSAQVRFSTYASTDCSGPTTANFSGESVGPVIGRGLWVRLRGGDVTQAGATVPDGTGSMRVFTILGRKTTGTLSANFDALFFAPVGKPLCKGLVPTIAGRDIDDSIYGTSGPDVIVAFDGDDTVYAGGGNDVVCAGKGDDTVFGEAGNDDLFGQGGDDELFGDEGDDVLKGGPGKDTLGGGPDGDVCIGGGGSDSAFSSCEKIRKVP